MAFLDHTLGIFTHPDSEWKRIHAEKTSFKQVFLSHVPFLALIPPVAAYFGVTQVGWTIGDGEVVKLTAASAISLCVLSYFMLLAGVFVLGEFTNWMSKTFGVRDSDEQRHHDGTALAVFVATPMLLAGIVLAYPQIWLVTSVLLIAGCYSVYLIYEGIPILMNMEKERGFIYASSILTVGLVLMVTSMIATVIIWGIGMGPVYIS